MFDFGRVSANAGAHFRILRNWMANSSRYLPDVQIDRPAMRGPDRDAATLIHGAGILVYFKLTYYRTATATITNLNT